MRIQRGHRCASVEKFAELDHPAPAVATPIPSQPVQVHMSRPGPARPGPSSPAPRPILVRHAPPARETVYRPEPHQLALPGHHSSHARKPYDRLSEVYSNSGDTVQFASNLRSFLGDSVPFYVWLLLAFIEVIVGLVSIFIGTYHYSMCELQPYIPLYLILSGSALVIHGLIRASKSIPQKRTRKSLYPNLLMHGLEAIALLYMLVCVILGCAWVYAGRSRYAQFIPNMFEGDYCDRTLYWTAWWSVTLHLAVFTVVILVIVFIVLYGLVVSAK